MNSETIDKKKEIYEKLKQINENLEEILDETEMPSEEKEEEQESISEPREIKPHKIAERREVIKEIALPIIGRDGNPVKRANGEPIRLKSYEKYAWAENGYEKKDVKFETKKGTKKSYVWVKKEKDYKNLDIHDAENPEVKYKDSLIDKVEEEWSLKKNIKSVKEKIKELKDDYSEGKVPYKEYHNNLKKLDKELLSLKVVEGSQHDAPGYVAEEMTPEEEKDYLAREEELEDKGKPLATLHLEKALFTNKWFFPISRASRENINVAGRPGWEVPNKGLFKILRWLKITRLFTQKKEYADAEEDEKFMYYVYLEDHRKKNPDKELIYKISTREMVGEEKEGKPFYGELWKYNKKPSQIKPTWSVVNRVCENFTSEDARSIKFLKDSYAAGQAGLSSIETEYGEKLVILEKSKGLGLRRLYDIGRMYELGLPFGNIPADECEIDEDVFASIVRGRQYTVSHKASNHVYAKIKKNRLKSLSRSIIPFFMAKTSLFNRKFELGGWKMEDYKIDFYDKDFIGSAIKKDNVIVNNEEDIPQSDYLAGTLALFTPFLERSGEYHNARFKFDKTGKPGKYHASKYLDKEPYHFWQRLSI